MAVKNRHVCVCVCVCVCYRRNTFELQQVCGETTPNCCRVKPLPYILTESADALSTLNQTKLHTYAFRAASSITYFAVVRELYVHAVV